MCHNLRQLKELKILLERETLYFFISLRNHYHYNGIVSPAISFIHSVKTLE